MSPARRTAAPRKRPTNMIGKSAAPVVLEGQNNDAGDAVSPPKEGPSFEKTKQEVLREFQAMLQQAGGLDDRNDAEQLEAIFAAALADLKPEDLLTKIDAVELKTSLESLGGSLCADQDNQLQAINLCRQINDAAGSFDDNNTALALEFSRRMQAHGYNEAMAWLREQQASLAADENAKQQGQESAELPRAIRNEVTKSRSRRLRGPPQK